MSNVPKGLIRAVKHSERKYKRNCANLSRIGFNLPVKISQTQEYKDCEEEWSTLTSLRNTLGYYKSLNTVLSRKFS